MANGEVQDRIEAGFERFGRGVVRHRWWAIASTLVLAVGLMTQLPPRIETAVENFLRADDPSRILYLDFQDQFGRQDMAIVSVKPPDVFDLGFLTELRQLHDELEDEVPHVDEVQSLINARSTRGEQDELIVEDLLEEFPSTPEQVAVLRERALANPFYRNTLISENGRFTALVVTMDLYASDGSGESIGGFDDEFGDAPGDEDEALEAPPRLSGTEMGEAITKIQEIIDRHERPDFQTGVAGSPVLQEAIVLNLQRDLQRFLVAMIAAITLLLAFLFRRASGVLLPLISVMLALGSTVGAMAAAGRPIMPPSQVLPNFLLAVGIGTAIHVLKIFYDHYDAGESVEDAVGHAMAHSGLAIVMTGATTAGGLLSFLVAGITPIEDLGRFAPLGVLLCQLYCLVLLPALLAVVPLKRRAPAGESSVSIRLQRVIVRMGAFSAANPVSMVVATGVLIAVSLTGVVRLQFTNDIMSWLPGDAAIRQTTDVIDRELKGSMTLEVVADTGRPDGVKDPAFLAGLEELRVRAAEIKRGDHLFIGRSISIADVIKEIHQALNENRPEFFAIPEDELLIAQEILLFENTGTDDLEDVVDTTFQKARFTLKVPYVDPLRYDGFIDEVEAVFEEVLPDSTVIDTTGFMGMMSQTITRVIEGMVRSYSLALAIITPLMILLLANLRTGLASMVPNLSPIILTLGLMGWANIPIDMFTMMIGSIAIGLVVDDTIHFMHGFQRYYAKEQDADIAIRKTLETTGQALLFTSVTLSLGFAVFMLSQMQNLFYFGLLTAFAIASAFLLDILVSPALMVLATRNRKRA